MRRPSPYLVEDDGRDTVGENGYDDLIRDDVSRRAVDADDADDAFFYLSDA